MLHILYMHVNNRCGVEIDRPSRSTECQGAPPGATECPKHSRAGLVTEKHRREPCPWVRGTHWVSLLNNINICSSCLIIWIWWIKQKHTKEVNDDGWICWYLLIHQPTKSTWFCLWRHNLQVGLTTSSPHPIGRQVVCPEQRQGTSKSASRIALAGLDHCNGRSRMKTGWQHQYVD